MVDRKITNTNICVGIEDGCQTEDGYSSEEQRILTELALALIWRYL
jgi:hypothetical protein